MIRHRVQFHGRDNALTGLEIVILLVIAVSIIGYVGYGESTHGKAPPAGAQQKQKQGMIPHEMVEATDLLTDPGGIYGYPAVDGTIAGIPVHFKTQNPSMLGAFELTVQPFMMNSGNIDMGDASVLWVSGTDQEKLALTRAPVLICPNWTITSKANLVPLKGANQDLFLETDEQFTLLVCPAGLAAPYQQFTMTIAPENGQILPLTRTVPPDITPVTNLG
ncbi:MAG: hypothetical protein Q8R70_06560 [Methanoregula sp.]|nr:hypothetical protein [Methanoregula sp.]